MTEQPGPGHGRKLGHRGVDASGETTYKKVSPLPLAGWDRVKGAFSSARSPSDPPAHTQHSLKARHGPWPRSGHELVCAGPSGLVRSLLHVVLSGMACLALGVTRDLG